MDISYAPAFLRQLKKLPKDMLEEVLSKIEQFKKDTNNISLKNHKLHGRLSGRYSFSVNYETRIIYRLKGKQYQLLDIGNHDLYR